MDTTPRPVTLPGLLALALLVPLVPLVLCGWTAVPARAAAEPDWILVAESIGEAGYYVDSNARYFKSDSALDLLRNAQDRATPVFIAVLPGDVRPAAAITQLKSALNRKGTYVVLAGDRLQASSTALPTATVQRAYTSATAANRGKPADALVAFVRELDERKVGKQVTGRTKTPQPLPEPSRAATEPAPQTGAPLPGAAQQAPRSAQEPEDSGNFPVILGAAAVIAAAAAGGFFLMRRNRRKPAPAGPGPLASGPPPASGGPGENPPSNQPPAA